MNKRIYELNKLIWKKSCFVAVTVLNQGRKIRKSHRRGLQSQQKSCRSLERDVSQNLLVAMVTWNPGHRQDDPVTNDLIRVMSFCTGFLFDSKMGCQTFLLVQLSKYSTDFNPDWLLQQLTNNILLLSPRELYDHTLCIRITCLMKPLPADGKVLKPWVHR